jgi:hypothetical protein
MRAMSKVDTDQGLGPGSEDSRRAVKKAQDDLESHSKLKASEPAAPVDKNAETQPGAGKVERRSDTVDDLLDGFGTSRPDLPRILPKEDTTPPPEPVKRELTPTSPGVRQQTRSRLLAAAIAFAIVVLGGVAILKMSAKTPAASSSATAPATATATATTATATATDTATAAATEVPPIPTKSVEALPTVAKTSEPPPAHSVHAASPSHTATAPTASPPPHATTTALAPHPPGSAPPGLNLLPDDPHR